MHKKLTQECLDEIDGEDVLTSFKNSNNFCNILKEKTKNDPKLYNRCLVFLHKLHSREWIVFKFQQKDNPSSPCFTDKDRRNFSNLYCFLIKTCFDHFGAKHINGTEYDPLENSWKVRQDGPVIINTLKFIHGVTDEEIPSVFRGVNSLSYLNHKFYEMVDDLQSLMALKQEDFVDYYNALSYV
jgi:hypothetical protein